MPDALAPEFGIERLQRQEQFLLDRAEIHRRAESGKRLWHDACAAALVRDAAAVAVLRGDSDRAKSLFHDAGSQFSRLGIFAGFSLLELSESGNAGRWWVEHSGLETRIYRLLVRGEGRVESEEATEPFLAASAASPRQLLHLYHALLAQRERDKRDELDTLRGRVGEMLRDMPAFEVGPTGIPLGGYLRLLDDVAHIDTLREGRLSWTSRETFLSAILRRQDQLRAARADGWHWRMVLNACDLVDVDLVAIGTLMVDRLGSTAPLEDIIGEREALVVVPLGAVMLLRPHPL